VPPAYPTRVRTTPGISPNRASGPQNHPMENVAVSVFDGTARSMGGMEIEFRDTFPLSFEATLSHAAIKPVQPSPMSPINFTKDLLFINLHCVSVLSQSIF